MRFPNDTTFHLRMAAFVIGSLFLEHLAATRLPHWSSPQIGVVTFVLGLAWVALAAFHHARSMQDKLRGQMALARKLRACDASDVARLVIEKHFIRDTKGNLRKFTQQEWRCVDCNEKFRRPPLIGRCVKCNGKILFTISEGSVIKYLEPSLSIAREFNVSAYLQQDLQLLARKIEDLFGKDKETQTGLGSWFG